MGVFVVLVLGLFAGLALMVPYEIIALTTRKVPTITEIVQAIILHFEPWRRRMTAPATWKGQDRAAR